MPPWIMPGIIGGVIVYLFWGPKECPKVNVAGTVIKGRPKATSPNGFDPDWRTRRIP